MQILVLLPVALHCGPKSATSTHERVGQIPGTRELTPDESYRLVYEVRADNVWILTLVHTARLWPSSVYMTSPTSHEQTLRT